MLSNHFNINKRERGGGGDSVEGLEKHILQGGCSLDPFRKTYRTGECRSPPRLVVVMEFLDNPIVSAPTAAYRSFKRMSYFGGTGENSLSFPPNMPIQSNYKSGKSGQSNNVGGKTSKVKLRQSRKEKKKKAEKAEKENRELKKSERTER
ncbi:hypothetical protein POVCU1_007750 [Plasmodium ovale curtisi]|uniref:Uncharacterized protein n=1 Tax=Plasmodium ovale curtisi TaxID=864141 RepID=A0A1A8VPN6_PLAOA|nr:hypothetical protein POVCU1_007750 [Plasmodium ovale curtisi]